MISEHLVCVNDGFNALYTKELPCYSYKGLDYYWYKGNLYRGNYNHKTQTNYIYLYRPHWNY